MCTSIFIFTPNIGLLQSAVMSQSKTFFPIHPIFTALLFLDDSKLFKGIYYK